MQQIPSVAHHQDPFDNNQLHTYQAMSDFDCATATHNPFFDLEISSLIGEGNPGLMDVSFADVANTSPRSQIRNRKEPTPKYMYLLDNRLTFGEEGVENPGPECVDMLSQSGDALSQSGDRAPSVSEVINKKQAAYSIDISEEEGAHL